MFIRETVNWQKEVPLTLAVPKKQIAQGSQLFEEVSGDPIGES